MYLPVYNTYCVYAMKCSNTTLYCYPIVQDYINPFATLGVTVTPFQRIAQNVRCCSDTFILGIHIIFLYSLLDFFISTPQWLQWQHILVASKFSQI